MKPKFSILSGLLWLIPMLVMASCSNPSSRSKITPTINITQSRQTVEARLTQLAGTPLTSSVPSASPAPVNTPAAQTPAVTSPLSTSPAALSPTAVKVTLNPSATAQSQPTADAACDRAAHGNPSIDVTIDDDTQMPPGNSFTKIWRLSNAGTCTWSKDYAAVLFSGEKLGDTLSLPLGREVAPGESVDIAVDMVAPNSPGTYQSNWKLRNAGGVLFGIGPNGDAPFWVRIIVVETQTGTPTAMPTPTPTVTVTHEPTAELTATSSPAPTLTPTLAPPINDSGTASMLPGEAIDLETGQKNTGADDDLSYQVNQNYHELVPISGTLLGVYGSLLPTREICLAAGMSTAPIAAESLSIGAYLCYRTPQGLPGWLHLTSFNLSDFSIGFDYQTWAAP